MGKKNQKSQPDRPLADAAIPSDLPPRLRDAAIIALRIKPKTKEAQTTQDMLYRRTKYTPPCSFLCLLLSSHPSPFVDGREIESYRIQKMPKFAMLSALRKSYPRAPDKDNNNTVATMFKLCSGQPGP